MELIERELVAFFRGMRHYVETSRESRTPLADAVADSFSVFDYIRPNENRLSTIISELLNPNGTHGQGGTFLAAFLDTLFDVGCVLPPEWRTFVNRAIVINEASTSILSNAARRIDIRIEFGGSFGIGIENKPWALEQTAQLSDYQIELDRRYQGKSILVFLSQLGRVPESMPTTGAQFR